MQGTWDEVTHADSQIAKIMFHEPGNGQRDTKAQELVKLSSRIPSTNAAADDLTRKTGDMALYGGIHITTLVAMLTCPTGYYLRSIGAANFIILMFCIASYSFSFTFSVYWLKWWTEAGSGETWFYIGGYIVLSTTAYITTNGIMW